MCAEQPDESLEQRAIEWIRGLRGQTFTVVTSVALQHLATNLESSANWSWGPPGVEIQTTVPWNWDTNQLAIDESNRGAIGAVVASDMRYLERRNGRIQAPPEFAALAERVRAQYDVPPAIWNQVVEHELERHYLPFFFADYALLERDMRRRPPAATGYGARAELMRHAVTFLAAHDRSRGMRALYGVHGNSAAGSYGGTVVLAVYPIVVDHDARSAYLPTIADLLLFPRQNYSQWTPADRASLVALLRERSMPEGAPWATPAVQAKVQAVSVPPADGWFTHVFMDESGREAESNHLVIGALFTGDLNDDDLAGLPPLSLKAVMNERQATRAVDYVGRYLKHPFVFRAVVIPKGSLENAEHELRMQIGACETLVQCETHRMRNATLVPDRLNPVNGVELRAELRKRFIFESLLPAGPVARVDYSHENPRYARYHTLCDILTGCVARAHNCVEASSGSAASAKRSVVERLIDGIGRADLPVRIESLDCAFWHERVSADSIEDYPKFSVMYAAG